MQWRYFTHNPTEIRAGIWHLGDGVLPGMISMDQRHPSLPILPRIDVKGVECAALIEGQAGYHMVKSGDYICRGSRGELYPVPPEIFDVNYTVVPNQPRKPITDDKIASDITDQVQSVIDAKGNPDA